MQPPLKAVEFSLLLALCDGQGHGYALVQRIEEESGGRLSLMPGNLYVVLRRLCGREWIREVPAPVEETDPRRRYYGITEAGSERLEEEVAAWERQLSLARRRLRPAGAEGPGDEG